MKKNTLSLLSCLAAIGMLLASCSSVQQSTAFTKRKYYNFRRHNPVVVFNKKANRHSAETAILTGPQTRNISPVITQPEISNMPAKQLIGALPGKIAKRPSRSGIQAIAYNGNRTQTAPAHTARNFSEYVTASTNTASSSKATTGNKSSVDPVLLIVLAILLPPLGVYLYDNSTSSRFWIVLALCLGAILLGVLLAPFLDLLWLAAIVYAILIVTGHA